MNIINGERASGRTTMLIYASYVTGARIICPSSQMARYIAGMAKEEGLDILEPMGALQYAEDAVHGLRRNERILLDNAERIIEEALNSYFRGATVEAITINCPNVLKSKEGDEAKQEASKA